MTTEYTYPNKNTTEYTYPAENTTTYSYPSTGNLNIPAGTIIGFYFGLTYPETITQPLTTYTYPNRN